jgi:hypothetical protein
MQLAGCVSSTCSCWRAARPGAAVFFIAFSWDALGRFGQFAGAQLLILAAVALYWRLGTVKVTAQVALLVAALLLGALLALYGQTYQTGADPWQLFAAWALLMLPWAAVGRFAPLWLLWLLLLNLSAALYYGARFGLLGVAFASKDDLVWLLFARTAWPVAWEAGARPSPVVAVRSGSMARAPDRDRRRLPSPSVGCVHHSIGYAVRVSVWGLLAWLAVYLVLRRRFACGGDLHVGRRLSVPDRLPDSLFAHWLLQAPSGRAFCCWPCW